MHFLSPAILLLLIPWGVLAAWLFRGKRPAASVPFLALWGETFQSPARSTAVRRPPLVILLCLASALLAIVAAAGPMGRRNSADLPLTVIVDRGVSMSADGLLDATITAADRIVRDLSNGRPIRLVFVPGEVETTTTDHWASSARSLGVTAIDTLFAVQATAEAELNRGNVVLVLSNLRVGIRDGRMMQVAPPTRPADTAIVALAARDGASPQVMVRLHSDVDGRRTLTVTGGGRTTQRSIGVAASLTWDEFVDVPVLGDSVEATISPTDAWPVNDRASLAREAAWPRVRAASALPAAVERMIDVYAKVRPASERSETITVAGMDVTSPSSSDANVLLLTPAGSPKSSGARQVVAHALTRDVDWTHVDPAATAAPPAGFLAVVSDGETPIVAVKENSPRQVWVNASIGRWSAEPSFVAFFSNVFDWVASRSGGSDFVSHLPERLGDEWSPVSGGAADGLWPGLYRRGDGALRAVNPTAIASLLYTGKTPLPANYASVADGDTTNRIARWLNTMAVALLVSAAITLAAGVSRRGTHTRSATSTTS